MNSKQLQQEIEATKAQLQRLQEQLEQSKTVTIETAQPSQVLPDGCVVVARYEDSVLLAAPANTQVQCQWTPGFSEVFKSLKTRGFTPSQWYVPSVKELQLAYKNCKQHFSAPPYYWSSTEGSSARAYGVGFVSGNTSANSKTGAGCVRAFRRVVL